MTGMEGVRWANISSVWGIEKFSASLIIRSVWISNGGGPVQLYGHFCRVRFLRCGSDPFFIKLHWAKLSDLHSVDVSPHGHILYSGRCGSMPGLCCRHYFGSRKHRAKLCADIWAFRTSGVTVAAEASVISRFANMLLVVFYLIRLRGQKGFRFPLSLGTGVSQAAGILIGKRLYAAGNDPCSIVWKCCALAWKCDRIQAVLEAPYE